jgi:hypothetical protein
VVRVTSGWLREGCSRGASGANAPIPAGKGKGSDAKSGADTRDHSSDNGQHGTDVQTNQQEYKSEPRHQTFSEHDYPRTPHALSSS